MTHDDDCLVYAIWAQKESARASTAMRWEYEHGGLSRVEMLQERSAWLSQIAREKLFNLI